MYLKRLEDLIDNGKLLLSDAGGVAGAGAEGGAAGAAGAGAAAAAAAAAANGAGAGDDDDGAAAGAAAPAAWREDWREVLADGDPKELARLKRFASPVNVFNSFRRLEQRVSSGQLKPVTLPEDASEAEIAEFRKQLGIPETPEGYGLEFPESLAPYVSERDQQELASVMQEAHKAHLPPGMVKTMFGIYTKLREQAAEALAEHVRNAEIETQAALRSEYGADRRRNLALADQFLAAHAGDEAPAIMQWELRDGTKLGNHLPFIRFVVSAARAYADEDQLLGPDGPSGGKSLDDRIKELNAKSADKRLTPEEDRELLKLYEQRTARDARRGHGPAETDL